MTQAEKEKQIKHNKIVGAIIGTFLGALICGLLGYMGGSSIDVYTDEEWKEIVKQRRIAELKYAEQCKIEEKLRRDKAEKLKELESKRLSLEKEIIELTGKTVTGFVYEEEEDM